MAFPRESGTHAAAVGEVVRLMGTQTRIKFISQGFKEILCSNGVQNLVTEQTSIIQNRANANNTRGGDGFSANVWMGAYGGGRWVGSVTTTDRKSKVAEAEDKALSRAVK